MRCKNCDGKYYSGKENTPLGRGYSAAVEKVGTKMRGLDKKTYVVKKYSNGKQWVHVSSSGTRKTSPRMFGWGKKKSENIKVSVNTHPEHFITDCIFADTDTGMMIYYVPNPMEEKDFFILDYKGSMQYIYLDDSTPIDFPKISQGIVLRFLKKLDNYIKENEDKNVACLLKLFRILTMKSGEYYSGLKAKKTRDDDLNRDEISDDDL